MDKIGLTAKQKQVFEFLRMYHRTYGVFPSTREIAHGKIDGQVILNKRVESNVQEVSGSYNKSLSAFLTVALPLACAFSLATAH